MAQPVKRKRLNVKSLKADPNYKKFGWYIEDKNIDILQDSLANRNATDAQSKAILSQVIPENGGRTTAHGNGAIGVVGWRGPRAIGLPTTLSGQIHKLMEEVFNNPKAKDWSHGGPGMNIKSAKEMYNFWKSGAMGVDRKATNAFMNGYVRPPEDQKAKRLEFVKLINKHYK